LLAGWTLQGSSGLNRAAYYIADRQLMPKIRSLVDFMGNRFGPQPFWDAALLQSRRKKKCATQKRQIKAWGARYGQT
jgi:hypothetical protein